MDKVSYELNASKKGWNCTGCGLFIDCIGRPIFGNEMFVITSNGIAWIENKPKYKFCPNCGAPVRSDLHG